ncbi:MAG TPA: 2-C-methyl-D-erythritol 4-phosphate cytidylyltransferase [Vicinamibacterales bacterium]|jgi:2-C-methyl-D-erythritol 4-phosphate cytidylyltransferase/2-C-methyl-D-erythritol 2,4-cyclodiphosphate synthase|nr:2-C-methyl-D-erythritol 4-phosphate cytidylyltransferase [Vicinamibacterales bacterium]
MNAEARRVHVTAIVAAGGRGARIGGPTPKQFLDLGGRTVLERSVRIFLEHQAVDDLVVALPRDQATTVPAWLHGAAKPVVIAEGGSRRQDSVANAFDRVPVHADVVLIHDAARPFASAALVSRTIAAAAASGAAVAAVPASDTVKQASEDGRFVRTTLARETIFLAQTPQAFRRTVLADAIALGRSGFAATDEAMLAERAGHRVQLVEGERANVKITTTDDLETVRRESHGRGRTSVGRVGIGYDLHRLVEGRPLILGGVVIPAPKGALGHSDADAVCHAVTDAILGAAGLRDIGSHFPDTDAAWEGASSLDMLARVARLVRDAGFAVAHVDVVVILEAPKLGSHREAMRARVAAALGIEAAGVSIKAKTNEGVDAVGRGEAIAAHAVATLETIG